MKTYFEEPERPIVLHNDEDMFIDLLEEIVKASNKQLKRAKRK